MAQYRICNVFNTDMAKSHNDGHCVYTYISCCSKREFEPNLLLAIGFGMFIINIPGAYNILYGTYGYTFTTMVDGVSETLKIGDQLLKGLTVSDLAGIPEIAEWLKANVSNFDGMDMVHKVEALENAVHALLPEVSNISVAHEVVQDQGLFFYLYKGVEWFKCKKLLDNGL